MAFGISLLNQVTAPKAGPVAVQKTITQQLSTKPASTIKPAASVTTAGPTIAGTKSSSKKKSSSATNSAIAAAEVTTMATAGQSVYSKIDSALGGYLPGGVPAGSTEINPLVSTGAKLLGATAATTAVIGGGIMAYNYFKKDGTPRKIKADGTPYKKPSMNYANPRALTRATRRLTSFKKHYAKSIRVLGYHVTRTGGK